MSLEKNACFDEKEVGGSGMDARVVVKVENLEQTSDVWEEEEEEEACDDKGERRRCDDDDDNVKHVEDTREAKTSEGTRDSRGSGRSRLHFLGGAFKDAGETSEGELCDAVEYTEAVSEEESWEAEVIE